MVLVFVRVRHQQHALVLVHIVFRVEGIVGNSLENQLVKTRCTGVSYAVDNYVVRVIHVETFIAKHQPILVQVNAVHAIYTALFIFRSPQDGLDVLLTQRAQTSS